MSMKVDENLVMLVENNIAVFIFLNFIFLVVMDIDDIYEKIGGSGSQQIKYGLACFLLKVDFKHEIEYW